MLVRIACRAFRMTGEGCPHGIEPDPTPGVLGHEGAGIVGEVGSLADQPSPERRPLTRASYRLHFL